MVINITKSKTMTWITYTTKYVYVDLTSGETYITEKAWKEKDITIIKTEKKTEYGKAIRNTTITKFYRWKPKQGTIEF